MTTPHAGACYAPGSPHPLCVMLGHEWRWVAGIERPVVIALHRSGLWVEFDESLFSGTFGYPIHPEPRLLASALQQGVACGMTGQHIAHVANDLAWLTPCLA